MFLKCIGNVLKPSITIVCRIDTLEKPSLTPKCVGFAVMKLCVDMSGAQPRPEMHPEDRVYLNAGQYLLPIVYGTVPLDGDFSEELMDGLPHIHGAYLAVRLFDPSVDVPNPPDDSEYLPFAQYADYGKYVLNTSVAGALVHAMPYSDDNVRKLPLSEVIMEEIQRGDEIGESEKRVVLRQCLEWLASIFPPLKAKLPLIDPRFMLPYEDRFGVFCALDMLYQMPVSHGLLPASSRAVSSKGLFPFLQKRPYDNCIRYHKTYFRYLPGRKRQANAHSGGNGHRGRSKDPAEESLADFIIDDASLEVNLSSAESCPVFGDDFSRTVGINFTPHACLLVVVTAVDILTSKELANRGQGLYNSNSSAHGHHSATTGKASSPSRQTPGGGMRTASSSSGVRGSAEDHHRRSAEEKQFKLRGLQGIYFNDNHVDGNTVWWGILPLLLESPFEKNQRTGHTAVNNQQSGKGSVPVNTPLYVSPSRAQNTEFHQMVRSHSNQKLESLDPSPVEDSNVSGRVSAFRSSSDAMDEDGAGFSIKKLRDAGGGGSFRKVPSGLLKKQGSLNRIIKQPSRLNLEDVSPESSFRNGTNANASNKRNNNYDEDAMRWQPHSSQSSHSQPTERLKYIDTNAEDQNNSTDSEDPNKPAWFVNAGTHQIPLFCGLPPDGLFAASNPMAWVLSHMCDPATNHQGDGFFTLHGTGALSCLGHSKSLDDVTPAATVSTSISSSMTTSEKKIAATLARKVQRRAEQQKLKKKALLNLRLSPGASAFISVVDPRLRSFSHDSVSRDASVVVKDDTLRKILRANLVRQMRLFHLKRHDKHLQAAGRKPRAEVRGLLEDEEYWQREKMDARFRFDARRLHPKAHIPRTFEMAFPPSIHIDTLFHEVNNRFQEIISESD